MKTLLKRINLLSCSLAAICTVLGCQNVSAQNMTSADLAQTMQRIYRNYDSIAFLTFDAKFTYGSDTLLGQYENEQLLASYTLAGKKAKYRMGDIDFMQNDSFFIAVYNDDKMILVDEPKMSNSGNQLPLRQMMDSMVQLYAAHYTINNTNYGDTSVITLDRSDTVAQLEKFSITYDNRNYMLRKIAYLYHESAQADSVGNYVMDVAYRKKRFTIQFFNYRYDNYDDDVYDEGNYIYFDHGIWKPVSRYSGFKIYNSRPSRNLYEDN